MTIDQAKENIGRLVAEALAAKGLPAQTLDDETLLLGGKLPIDSLDLAGIVVNLSELSETDPFANGFIEFRTVGELARLYAG